MNKTELIEFVVQDTGLSKKAVEMAVTAAIDLVAGALASGISVKLVNFGSFEVKKRNGRVGRNPRTGEVVNIPASRHVVFKAGKALKEAVNK